MVINHQKLVIDSLKEEGMSIVDKRGLKFENDAERYLLFENHLLIDNYIDWFVAYYDEYPLPETIQNLKSELGIC